MSGGALDYLRGVRIVMESEFDVLKYVPECHRPIVEQFLIHNWVYLAADCYRNYLKQGRGLMTLILVGDTIDLMYLSWLWLQLHWDDAFGDADRSMQDTIKRLVPTYNPEDECVLLFESDDDEQSSVIRITQAIFSQLIAQPGTVVPRIRRQEGVTPKEAYEILER